MLSPHFGRDLAARIKLHLAAPPAGSRRIAVLGNCQAGAIARAIRLLCPDATVRFVSAGTLGRSRIRPDQVLRRFVGYDHVFAQTIPSGHLGAEHYAALAEDASRFRPVPAIVFAAFHPDLVYVGGPGTPAGRYLDGPVGHYHSAIALYAFLNGFSVAQTARLFTRETYAYLGYLDLWSYAQDTLLELGREAGMDLAPHLLRWARRGAFMHSVNHPRMIVVADLARILLTGAGIPYADFDLDGFLLDDLGQKGMWPIYEPIAHHYGVAGSMMFQASSQRGPTGRVLDLAGFLAACFALYEAQPRRMLVSDRVESWRANDDLHMLFRNRAG